MTRFWEQVTEPTTAAFTLVGLATAVGRFWL